jgi:hypothetical protein
MSTFTVTLMDYFDETPGVPQIDFQQWTDPQDAARLFVEMERKKENNAQITDWKVMVEDNDTKEVWVYCLGVIMKPKVIIIDTIPWPRPEDTEAGLPPCSKDCGSKGTPFERGCDDCDMKEDDDGCTGWK